MNCLDCEEYDNEKHYCPKFCSVIRNTMDEIIRDRIPVEWIRKYTEENRLYQSDDFDLYISDMIADWAERKDGYVTPHQENIHFIDEDAERAFYESLAERKEE